MTEKEILVIVAHPDDETIWVGGTLLKAKLKKTIISLCRKNDKDRFPKFEKACKILNSNGYISDLDDLEEEYYKKISNQEVIERILKITKKKKYDYLYTHGENGEYGHIRHIEVHRIVNEMLDKKLLSVRKIFFFSYKKRGKTCNINPNADILIKLKEPIFKMKKQLIQKIYGFKKGSFEERCCRNVEAFDIKR
jgi:LmbE family N-acetylglucosaminyl deacetylase